MTISEYQYDDLVRAIRLIQDLLDGRLTAPDFVHNFGGLYYQCALDGHETEGIPSGYEVHVELVRAVQQEVLDMLIPDSVDGGDVDAYLSVGRIAMDDVYTMVISVVAKAAVRCLLQGEPPSESGPIG